MSYRKSVEYRIPQEDDEDEKQKEERESEQLKIDESEPLNEEENAEKERLYSKGFSDWTKKDFLAFTKACERYGRDSLDQIAAEVEGKSLEEVKQYSAVFWKRFKELSGI